MIEYKKYKIMEQKNSVYIATSLDGKIADANGSIDFLQSIPIPAGEDMGYAKFMDSIDALVMGRTTFETVMAFDHPWPYNKPVFVLSTTMKSVPPSHEGKVFLVAGPLKSILEEIYAKGFHKLYIDGGRTIQSFIREDLVDELIITVFPVLLGGGASLFGEHETPLSFKLKESNVFANEIVQNHFVRDRENYRS